MESSGPIQICVRVIGQLQRNVAVNITASSITAQPGLDFVFGGGTLVFSSGVEERCVDFNAPEEGIVEEDETVLISLNQDGDTSLLDVVVTIEDSSTLSFAFEMNTYSTNESDPIDICVNLVQGSTVRNVDLTLSVTGMLFTYAQLWHSSITL